MTSEYSGEKLQRQVQITRFNTQITLVTDHPYEDMDYLTEKAIKLMDEVSDEKR